MKKIFFSFGLALFIFLFGYKTASASPCSVSVTCPVPETNCFATITGFTPNVNYELSVDGVSKASATSPTDPGASFVITFPNNMPTVGNHNLLVGTLDSPPDACGTSFDDNRLFTPTPLPPTATAIPTPPTTGGGGPIQTAIGPIDPTNLQEFIKTLLALALGAAGGIAFLLMLFGAFQIMTSSGNPERMKAGQELITSALTGLLFIIFSIFILRFIGVTLFEIPGFGQ